MARAKVCGNIGKSVARSAAALGKLLGAGPSASDGGDGERGADVLRAALKSLSGAFAGVALFSVAVNVLMLAGPIFMLEVYDRVLPSGSVPTLFILSAFVVGVFAVQSLIDAIRGRVLARMGASLDMQLGPLVYRTLVRIAIRRGASESLRPVRDLEAVRAFLTGLGPTALFDLPWIPIYIGVVYALHPLLGLTAIAGAALMVILAAASEWLLRKPARIGKEREEERIAFAEASGRNAEALSAMGLAGRMGERWRRLGQNSLDSQRQASDIAGGFGALSKGLRLVLQSALLAIGAYLVIDGQATGGVMIASSILAARALAPVDLAIAHSKAFIAARQGWRRLRELIEALPDESKSIDLPAPRKELAAEGLIVMPPGGERVIV
jgi:ABC-type protease/lipase transport system fused ATPase/permease subunit